MITIFFRSGMMLTLALRRNGILLLVSLFIILSSSSLHANPNFLNRLASLKGIAITAIIAGGLNFAANFIWAFDWEDYANAPTKTAKDVQMGAGLSTSVISLALSTVIPLMVYEYQKTHPESATLNANSNFLQRLASLKGIAVVAILAGAFNTPANFMWAFDWERFAGASTEVSKKVQMAGGLIVSGVSLILSMTIPLMVYEYQKAHPQTPALIAATKGSFLSRLSSLQGVAIVAIIAGGLNSGTNFVWAFDWETYAGVSAYVSRKIQMSGGLATSGISLVLSTIIPLMVYEYQKIQSLQSNSIELKTIGPMITAV